MRAFIIVGIALSLLGSVRAAEAVLCRTRTRAVVLRDACRGKEVPIDLTVVGASGTPGAAGADGPAGSWTWPGTGYLCQAPDSTPPRDRRAGREERRAGANRSPSHPGSGSR